jgi:toxin ParE1/3/4
VKRIVIHPEALDELDEAIAFYERRAKGLGVDLRSKAEAAVARIQETPQSWPPHKPSGFRKYFAERFPYIVHYMEASDFIWIIAFAHAKRRPNYWRRRKLET